jgi:predicted oxidoreductase
LVFYNKYEVKNVNIINIAIIWLASPPLQIPPIWGEAKIEFMRDFAHLLFPPLPS